MHNVRPRRFAVAQSREARAILKLVVAGTLVAASLQFTHAGAAFSPTLQTDRGAYAAGDEVTISGQGFAPGEAVTLIATHDDGTDEPAMGHDAWVTSADENGDVSGAWAIRAGDTLGRRFVVRASGTLSGVTQSATFLRAPQVGTARAAYVASEAASIEGRDFVAGETVTLQVTHADGTAESGMAHETFVSTAGPDGAFWATWTSSFDDVSGPSFIVTAAGDVSGSIAPASFRREGIVEPDKGDYEPGETVVLVGRAFAPGEVVQVQVTHVNGLNNGNGHQPFFVSADASGSFTTTWFVDPDDSLYSKFLVSAVGQTSSVGARATFWDAGTVSLTTLGTASTQNFDTLASTGTSSTVPTGWDFTEAGANANTLYTAGTGSSATGDTYSFGTTAERAFGGLQSGTVVPAVGAQFTNNTGGTITSLTIAYTGEEWRRGQNIATNPNPDRIDFQYSLNATSLATGTWTDADALDFSSPFVTTLGLRDGNAAGNRTALSSTISGLIVPAGTTFWIRWNSFDLAPGADDGLAVDDFSITPAGTVVADTAPSVVSTLPANTATGVALSANVAVTFSEPVNATAASFTLACGTTGTHTFALSGGPTAFSLNPDTDFGFGETCTLTVLANQVTDQDGIDPANMATDVTASFSTPQPPVAIHDIQGEAHTSPKVGTTVTTVPAIVTALRNVTGTRGFYIQDINPDSDDATSEAVFVFTGSSSNPSTLAAVGNLVQVTGTVSEFRSGGGTSDNLTVTEIVGPLAVNTISTGNALPAPVVIGAGGRTPPGTVIDDDATGSVETSGSFDATTDGIDFWESLEGMRVQVNDAVVVGPTADFTSNREVPVLVDNGAGAGLRTARGGIVIQAADFNPERIILNDLITGGPALPAANVGDAFPGATVGFIDYSFGNFKLQVSAVPARVDNNLQQEVTAAPGSRELSVGTFNVENLAPGDPQAKFDRLAGLIVNNLKAPDLLAIEEIQDNSGASDNAVVDATTTWGKLIAAIGAAGGPAYDFRQIDPVNDQDGGQPGGNIRQGFLFRSDRGLAFIDRTGGTSLTPNVVVGTGAAAQLLYSPGRIAPTNAAFNSSRKPLAGEFTFRGQHFFVIANHFNSKGGDDALFGRFQPPVNISEAQRHQQAQVEHEFIQAILDADPSANIVVMGDINDFEFSDAVTILKGSLLHDLMDTLPGNERYSYVFEGNSQTLDHILFSGSLFDTHPFTYDVVHVNSEFADQASDHEPQVVHVTVNDPPTVGAGGPYTMNEGDSVSVSATGSDPNGDSLTYAWDLDNNGSFETAGQTVSFPLANVDGPGVYTVKVKATDAGGLSAEADTTVTVSNVPPTVNTLSVGPEPSVEGQAVTASATFSDPGPNDAPFTCAVDYGDGSGALAGVVVGSTCTGPSHAYTTFGAYSVSVRVTDKDGGVGDRTMSHDVNFAFTGFLAPVDNPPVMNRVKAGQEVELKFRLGGNKGLGILKSVTSAAVNCAVGAGVDDITDPVLPRARELEFENGMYEFEWKTQKAWFNQCRLLTLTLTDDTAHSVLFMFKK